MDFRCWMHESHCQWVLTVPVFASILTSLLFLMNVMRVLLTKLHRNSTNPAPIGVRKAVRAALILVPLFGIHYILIPYRPKHKTTVEIIYQIFSVILVSTQVSEITAVESTPVYVKHYRQYFFNNIMLYILFKFNTYL